MKIIKKLHWIYLLLFIAIACISYLFFNIVLIYDNPNKSFGVLILVLRAKLRAVG